MRIRHVAAVAFAAVAAMLPGAASASDATATRYLVLLEDGAAGSAAAAAVSDAGGSVTFDLSRQIGVLVADSASSSFAADLAASALVESVAADLKWKAMPSTIEAAVQNGPVPGGGPEAGADPFEPIQWSMQQIRAPQARAIQAGSRLVEVGVLDSGIDGDHPDFNDVDGSNVNCAKGRDFVLGFSPGIGNPDPCTDNQIHGTHVAGIVGARLNGIGAVGVAPNVTLVPIKVCDAIGFCYASSSAAGIVYAADAKLEVINMSYYIDDDEFFASTAYKCMNDPAMRVLRRINERALQYARSKGVTPVAATTNADQDLAHPPEPFENNCDHLPVEGAGVIGVAATGPTSDKASYSNYGVSAVDVIAPGGDGATGNCATTVLSTFPFPIAGGWFCIDGTSMASPHAAGVAALIVSQYGRLDQDGDVEMPPTKVESYLQSTTVDLGPPGYDECYGNGRVDAVRAVLHDTSRAYEPGHVCEE